MGGFTESARGIAAHVFVPTARLLVRLGISPDAVTIVGTLGTSVAALYFFPRGEFFVGTLVICIFVFSDALDGTMARLKGQSSSWGAFLDSTLDRVADSAVFCGIALWFVTEDGGHDLLMASVALAALVGGLLVSYARARAEGLGARATVGIAERTERLVLTLVAAGLSGLLDVPWLLDAALWVVAVLSWITVVQRIWVVRSQLLVQG